MGCRCQNKNALPKYTDLTNIPAQPWEEAKYILGKDSCGNIMVLEKPLYELSEEDREKLDLIVTDGNGTLFLSDDGTYKALSADKVQYITLDISDGPINFAIRNNEKIQSIVSGFDSIVEPIIRMDIDGNLIPFTVIYNKGKSELILQTEVYVYNVPVSRAVITEEFKKVFIIISVNVASDPVLINHYDIRVSDVKEFLTTEGDGTKALFDDGNYRDVYTKEEVDNLIDSVEVDLSNYYTKPEVDEKITELNSSIEAVRDDVDEKISEVDDRISDAVFYDNDDIKARNNIILKNDANLLGMTLAGGQINLIQCSRFTDVDDNGVSHPITDIGSTSAHITINSFDRPNVQLSGESGNHLHQVAYLSEVIEVGGLLNTEIEARRAGDEDLQTKLDSTNEYAQDTRNALLEAQEAINEDLGNLGDRVSQNETDIAQNKTDIAGIRQDIADTEHFRGYHLTTDEITAIERPESGDYAWNAETGTVWTYNGTTWLNSGAPIPDQSAPAYDGTPLEDGEASPGFTNEYSRGDHRHPSDSSKADLTALNDYLPLAGNSQTTPITGDAWFANSARLRLSSSGNSFIAFSENDATLQIKGNGIGGIDLQSDNGVVKANGQRVIVNGQNTPNVQIAAPVIQLNATEAGGSGLSLGSAQTALSGNILSGTFTGNIGLTSSTGNIVLNPTVGKAYYGDSNIPGNEIAKLSDIEAVRGEGETNLSEAKEYTDNSVSNALNSVSENYVNKSGDTMTGGLTLSSGNITIQPNQSVRFSGDGSVRMEYNTADSELIIEAVTTGRGIDIRTNPSVEDSKLRYNGVEVATISDVNSFEIKVYEGEVPAGSNVITLTEIPTKIIDVFFDRVILYSDEYEQTGSAITITADNLNFEVPNRVKVNYII